MKHPLFISSEGKIIGDLIRKVRLIVKNPITLGVSFTIRSDAEFHQVSQLKVISK